MLQIVINNLLNAQGRLYDIFFGVSVTIRFVLAVLYFFPFVNHVVGLTLVDLVPKEYSVFV